MKDFRDSLQVREERGTWRLLEPVSVGNFELSIQASSGHYCSPRLTLENLNDYGSFEVAVFENDKRIFPSTDNRFSEFTEIAEECSWIVNGEEIGSCIFPYMSIVDVQRLYETVCEIVAKQ